MRKILFILMLLCIACLEMRVKADDSQERLSRDVLASIYDSGEIGDVCRMRLFADDDYGLRPLFEYLVEKYSPQISNPYRLLPRGKNALFIGILSPEQKMHLDANELLEFAKLGNVAIVLTDEDGATGMLSSLELSFDEATNDGIRSFKFSGDAWHYWKQEHGIVWRRCGDKGLLIIVGDSFAFAKRRFLDRNNTILGQLLQLYPDEIKAVRLIQRKRYIRADGRAVFDSINRNINAVREKDPAFAPAFTDSNDKNTYLMTQQEFFSMERYYELPSTENSEFRNMMRVRTYDCFIPPNKDNPKAWHFAIGTPNEKELAPTPNFQAPGYKVMKVATLFKPGVPPSLALLAGICPDSVLLDITIHNVALKDPHEKELEERVSNRRKTVVQLTKKKKNRFGLFQLPDSDREKRMSELTQQTEMLKDEEAELQRIKVQNGRPDIDRLEDAIANITIKVFSDGLHNLRVETEPPVNTLEGRAFVYHLAYRTDYLRSDNREFKENLLPHDMRISQWRKANECAGVKPCQVPHEAAAFKRLATGTRTEWLLKSKSPKQVGQPYLPKIVSDALNGEDVRVLPLLKALTQEFKSYKDTVIQLADEFNTFSEAMVYWRGGVCRHRARAGFMLLNTLGIPARMVVSRSHAFVEIFVPKENGGFWTQVNFGGGFGDEPGDLFPEVSLPVAAALPSPSNLPMPSSGVVPSSSIAFFAKHVFFVSIAMIAVLSVVLFLLGLIKHKSGQLADNRIPMTSLTDFMLSQSQILEYDLTRGEYRGAALVLLEAALPRLPATEKERYASMYRKLQDKNNVSRQEYLNLVKQLSASLKGG